MFRYFLIFLLSFGLPASTRAQDGALWDRWNATVGVDVLSDYLSDGVSKSDGAPVAQLWGGISPHQRLTLRARLSPIDLADGRHTEITLDASTKWIWGPVHFQAGVAQYRTIPFAYATHEGFLQLGGDIRGLMWGTLKISRFDDGTTGIYTGTWQNFPNGWAISNYAKLIRPTGPYSYGTDVIKTLSDKWTASIGFQSRLPEDRPIMAAKLTYRFR